MMTVHVVIIVVQNKTQSYTKRALKNYFIPFAIETYYCFHPRFNSFLFFLCTYQYSLPFANLLGTFNAYILL
jgi:hypothetical protein